MLKYAIKYILRNKQQDLITEKTRNQILEKIAIKDIYTDHYHYFAQLANYYLRHNKFTQVQLNSVRNM